MNDMARRMMMNRDYRRGRDYRGNDYRGDYRGRDYGEGEYRGSMEYSGDYGRGGRPMPVPGPDGRRGVKGTGRYGIGGSRYYGRDRGMDEYEEDGMYRDYYGGMDGNMDYTGHEDMRLTKQDMMEWKRKIKNADGSSGEHFDHKQIADAASKIGIRFDHYDDKELAMTANMLFSDYCDALRAYIPQEKEAIIYTKMARAFLEDEDAPKGSEKLALYYYCIADANEE